MLKHERQKVEPSLTVRKDGLVFENFIMSLIPCNYNSNKKMNVKAA